MNWDKKTTSSQTARPFVKWVGGKSRLVPTLLSYFPDEFNNYYEPFVGGGALYFSINPSKAFINDLNEKTFTSSEDMVFEPIEIDKISDWPILVEDDTAPNQPFKLVGVFPMPDDPPLSSYTNPFTGELLNPLQVSKGIYI